MSLNHDNAQRWIDQSLHGSLDPQAEAALARHLAGCPACAAYRDRLAGLDARLRALLPAQGAEWAVSPAEISRQYARIYPRIERKMSQQRIRHIIRPAMAVAVIFILVAGLAWVFGNLAPRPAIPGAATETPTPAPTETAPVEALPTAAVEDVPPALTPETPVSTEPGRIVPGSLVWDPAGKRLAYADSRGGAWIDQAEPRLETRIVPPYETQPGDLRFEWSPDGAMLLVYATWETATPVKTGIWVYSIGDQGIGLPQPVLEPADVVSPVAQNDGRVTAAAWSPDGTRIAYTFQAEAWVYNLRSGEVRRVTGLTESPLSRPKGSEPFDGVREIAWSPDGARLALGMSCNCASPWSGVGVVDLGTGETRLLVDGGNDVSWTPDGKSIAFRNATGDWSGGNTYDYYTIDPVGGKITNLTHSNPAWDPLLDPAEKFAESAYQVSGLQWGADGRYFVQTQSFQPGGLSAHSLIVRSDPDTIVKEFLSDSRELAWEIFPVWLADGRLAYLVAEPVNPDPENPGLYRLRRAEIEGRDAIDLSGTDIFSAAWSPDGATLALLTSKQGAAIPGQVTWISISK